MLDKHVLKSLAFFMLVLSGCSSTPVLEGTNKGGTESTENLTEASVNLLSVDRKEYQLAYHTLSLIPPNTDCMNRLSVENDSHWILFSGAGKKSTKFAVQTYSMNEFVNLKPEEFYSYNKAYYQASLSEQKDVLKKDVWIVINRQLTINLHPAYQVVIADNQERIIVETAILQNGMLFTVTAMYPWDYHTDLKSFSDLPTCYTDFVRSAFVKESSKSTVVGVDS